MINYIIAGDPAVVDCKWQGKLCTLIKFTSCFEVTNTGNIFSTNIMYMYYTCNSVEAS